MVRVTITYNIHIVCLISRRNDFNLARCIYYIIQNVQEWSRKSVVDDGYRS